MPALTQSPLPFTAQSRAAAELARGRKFVDQIRKRAAVLERVTTSELQRRVNELRESAAKPSRRSRFQTQRTQAEAFALIAEGVRRSQGKTYYDVQLLGGIALAQGRIIQMQTGEGKTLTSALPAFVRAVSGSRVHVATTNAYLAARDCEELRPAFEVLGMTVGLLPEEHDEAAKRIAYECDVTFGTGYDFGFDFLRDQLAIRSKEILTPGIRHIRDLMGVPRAVRTPIQPSHHFAVVDEADSVLIDEATMPLILSSTAGQSATPEIYELAQNVALDLNEGDDFERDADQKRIDLTSEGWQNIHAALQHHPDLPLARHWSMYVMNALRARLLLNRDVDYVVLDGTIQIVDQHTGRIHDERTWRDGLHQAIETKERVEVTPETASDARVTRQRYFQLYDSMAGMSGTVVGVQEELRTFYQLSTVVIPTHRPCIREALATRAFVDDESRNAAIVDEAKYVNQSGQPLLVGTRTIRHSRELSRRLHEGGLSHTVLNGLQDEDEAAVVSKAGRCGAITIATNMAGRGTDIALDSAAKEAGGLYVIGAEPNLSRRVDRQLAGRAARQGNPGTCRFYTAATDEIFGTKPSVADRILANANDDGECPQDMTDTVNGIQSALEQRDFETRRQMVSRDHWLDDILQTLAGRK